MDIDSNIKSEHDVKTEAEESKVKLEDGTEWPLSSFPLQFDAVDRPVKREGESSAEGASLGSLIGNQEAIEKLINKGMLGARRLYIL